MKVLIVEDERPSVERLQMLLHNYDPSIEIAGNFESIEETVKFLEGNPHPDLILLDIHLSDGHSFEIFRQVRYSRPVIFITAHDGYALQAFQLFSIDYVLKPVSSTMLYSALDKFRSMSNYFTPEKFRKAFETIAHRRYKDRFLGKVGQRLFFIDVKNIAFFEADNKIVYLVDIQGNRYIVEYKMDQLINLLDPSLFFRLNRSFIVHCNAIEQVKPHYNNRLKLVVTGAAQHEELVIARDRVPSFRQWADA